MVWLAHPTTKIHIQCVKFGLFHVSSTLQLRMRSNNPYLSTGYFRITLFWHFSQTIVHSRYRSAYFKVQCFVCGITCPSHSNSLFHAHTQIMQYKNSKNWRVSEVFWWAANFLSSCLNCNFIHKYFKISLKKTFSGIEASKNNEIS